MNGASFAARLPAFALRAVLCACASISAAPDAVASTAQHGHASETGTAPTLAPSPVTIPLDAATLSAVPRESIRASAHGKTLDCEGMTLAALLQRAGAMPADNLPGSALARYVLVSARDGYRVLYSLAELDPGTGKRKVFVVDRCSGKPLEGDEGPLRLIAPEDARHARWVRQVESITVVAAP